ncbi:MAG: response regulator transcription factor, partial [Bdellovibrionales bacterium]|nr:response regulator transcription factor [Bdellovibrionales bacterium]
MQSVLAPRNTISIVIAEDHTLVRKGVKTILEDQDSRYEVIGESETAEEAIALVKSLGPDLLLLDLSLPDKNGLEVIRLLRAEGNSTQIIVLTMHDDEDLAIQAIQAGADSYILKDFSPEGLVQAIEQTILGECVLPESLLHIKTGLDQRGDSSDPLHKLSKREREVFFHIANGKPNREIAKLLYISPRTVET